MSILKLLFSGNSFLKSELEHIEMLRSEGMAFRPAEEDRDEFQQRIADKRSRILHSAVLVVSIILASFIAAKIIAYSSSVHSNFLFFLRSLSVFLITWSLWSKLDDISTMKGLTLLEVTSARLYRIAYMTGVFIGSLSLFLT